MPSLLISGLVDPSSRVSMSAIGAELGLAAPYSLTNILQQVASKTFSADITTAGLEALGGTAGLTIYSDGRYETDVHMHDSGATSYKFFVAIAFAASGDKPSIALGLHSHGEVEGTDKTVPLVHEPNREFYDNQKGTDDRIRQFWYRVKNGQLNVSKAYSHTGIEGAVESVLKGYFLDFVGILLGGELLPPVFGAIYLTNLFTQLADKLKVLGTAGLAGLLASGAAFVLVGPTVMFPVFVAGAVAMEAAGPRNRRLTQDEKTFADKLFNGTIDLDIIWITDMVGLGGRPFTVPGMDGSIIINLGLGNYYDDVTNGFVAGSPPKSASGIPGYYFIHEMTHAWEIQNGDFAGQGFLCSEGILWKDAAADNSLTSQYKYGPPVGAWGKAFNPEQRASIVADWFFGTWIFSNTGRTDVRPPHDPADEYFKYIKGNIWVGSF